MLADFSQGSRKATTLLTSPEIHDIFSTCKIFFSLKVNATSGDDFGQLLVYMRTESTEITLAVYNKDTILSSHYNSWHQQRIQLGRNSGSIRIVFRAQKG